jgi:hypothetical protein
MLSDRRRDQATATIVIEALRMKTAFGIGAAHALAARNGVAPRTAERALAGRHDPRQPNSSQPGQYQARRNTVGERAVEASLDLQKHCGTKYAAGFLSENGIDFETALRVLKPGKPCRNLSIG